MAVVSAALLQARAEGALAELYAQTRCVPVPAHHPVACLYNPPLHTAASPHGEGGASALPPPPRRAADEARPRELAAALVLQKYGRGYLVRKRLDRFRCVRGVGGAHGRHALREKRTCPPPALLPASTLAGAHKQGLSTRKR